MAQSIGNPEHGEELFNAMQPETGFACATCHYTDTTEQLVGPGLMGVADPQHDHSAHAAGEDDHAQEADDHEHETETVDTAAILERVDYIREAIVNPSAFVVPEFPDNVMPKVYGDLFTEEELNDLIAYLITLR